MAKGTTSETGIVESYFANPFGAPQYLDDHEVIAEKFFSALFKNKTIVGQLKTRLGLEGFETEGPESAARALFEKINTFVRK